MLEKIGLAEKEAKVYLALLELAQDSVQNIAKKAKVTRPNTYVILEKLLKMGLVSSHQEGKKTLFVATSPTELENIIDKQIKELELRKKELKESMNQMTAIYNVSKDKPVVRYFEGADGLEALDRYGRDQLKKNTEILNFSPFDLIEKYFPDRRKKSLNERVKLGIKSRTIYTRKDGALPTAQNKQELREGVFISNDVYPFDASMTIYPEWGIKFYYYNEVNPYGVALESKELARNMKYFFELSWSGAKTLNQK